MMSSVKLFSLACLKRKTDFTIHLDSCFNYTNKRKTVFSNCFYALIVKNNALYSLKLEQNERELFG